MSHCELARRGKLVGLLGFTAASTMLFCLAPSPLAFAQSSTTGKGDTVAVAVIESAMSQLGGGTVLAALQDVEVTGTCALSGNSQNPTTTFSWTASGQEFRYEADGSNVLVSGHGRPVQKEAGGAYEVPGSFADAQKAFFAPAFLLYRERNDPEYAMFDSGQTSSGENIVDVARSAARSVLQHVFQRWYFDPLSHLPVRVEYWSPSVTAPNIGTTITLTFSKYTAFGGIPFPTEITMLRGTTVVRRCSVAGVRINTQPADSMFDMSPDGGTN